MTMKVTELAKSLNVEVKTVLMTAKSLGIEVKTSASPIDDDGVQAIRKSLQATPKKAGTETKIVRAAQKSNVAQDPGTSKVQVKPAKVAQAPAAQEKPAVKKAPVTEKPIAAPAQPAKAASTGKPGTRPPLKGAAVKRVKKTDIEAEQAAEAKKAEEEARKAAAEEAARIAAEEEAKKAAEEAAKKAEEEAKAAEEPAEEPEKAPEEAPAEEPAEEPAEGPAEEPAPEEEPETAEGEPAEAPKEEEKKEEERPDDGRQRLKIIKTAEQVAEEQKKAKEERAAKKKEAQKNAGQEQPADRSDKRGSQGRAKKTFAKPDAVGDIHSGKPGKKGKGKDKGRDNRYYDEGDPKFPRSLEKQTKKKHVRNRPEPEPEEEAEPLPVGTKVVNVPITVAGFCEQVGITISQAIMTLLKMGMVANQNQSIDEVTVSALADELGIQVVIGSVEEEEEEEGLENFEDREKDLKPRPPIITVMGHVDHGKTSLLDAIRNTNVTAGESGGITQHIGASEVEINGQKIVFLDTPGHEAFTAMRARGADITDIAVLVVAADDSVKPQTVESISHAKAAGVPIIVAINKMDKPGANPEMVKKDLADHGVLVEEWGGDTICVPVSAKTGEGIVNLLEMILLQAEVLELKANPNRLALGTVIEARLDKAKGPVATLLITNGTMKAGQSLVAGTCAGRIRLMTNYKGETIRKAGPATAVEILGLSDVPAAGDSFNVVSEDKVAKEIAAKRQLRQREEVMARTSGSTLEDLFSQIREGEVKELPLIIKADVMGSVGAVTTSLEKLSNENVKVKVIHSGVGAINESDVILAGTSGAIIIGFNVRPTSAVQSYADSEGVQIRTYRVIYDIIDDVDNAMKGMLDPEFKEEILGEAEVRDTFKVPGVGIIAGAYVTKGKVTRNAEVRLVRDGIVVHEGKVASLRRFKDDAREVAQGFECGIGIESYNDIKIGDIIEFFEMVEVERDDQ